MRNVWKIYLIAIILPVLMLSTASCSMMMDSEALGPMKVHRCVLVYLAADNNLSSNAKRDIEEMKSGDIPYYFDEGTGDVLLVYSDIKGEVPKLMRLSKDRFGTVNTEVLMEYEDQNSCSDSVMRSVLLYASTLFPAEENGLVLWSHGTGWLPAGYYSHPYSASQDGQVTPQSLDDPYAMYVKSFGADNGEEMDIKSLADALPIQYSFILIDACLMGGIEVAYELKNSCNYFIGSAAEILAAGFPYDRVIGHLFEGEEGLKQACLEFYDYYKDDGATVVMLDTRKLNMLAESCLDIFLSGRVAIQNLDMDSMQGYFRNDRHWFYDLDDLISRIASEEQYARFSDAMEELVVCKYATEVFTLGGVPQFPITKFSGLSTYVPNPENPVLDIYYRSLAWNLAVKMVE